MTFTPTAASCPQPNARCQAVTYYEPTITIPSPYVYTNRPGYFRDFNGVELTLRKRYANRWMASFSYAYNDAVDHYDSKDGYEDPTQIPAFNNAQYSLEAGGSGIDNVFINSKWVVKAAGMYTLPWDINLGASYNGRQGYLMPQFLLSPSRPNRGGTVRIYLDPWGDVRLPTFQTLDVKVDKTFNIGKLRVIPSMDVFNLTNSNVVMARRIQQNSPTANNISGIVAPRVIRFGVRATW
jgi:hypothetical protein